MQNGFGGHSIAMLTDRECKQAKPAEKPFKLADSHGLHLYVRPTGAKSWRLKYRIAGREKQVVFGTYPDLRLAEARALTALAKQALRDGRDPAQQFGMKAKRHWTAHNPDTTFESVAKRWYELQTGHWKPIHAQKVRESLEANFYPTLGKIDIKDIKAKDIRDILAKVQERGALETAFRLLQRISAIFAYAIAEELVEADPSRGVAPSLKKVIKKKQPALLSIQAANAFLRAFEALPTYATTKMASRLLALTAARPGMVQMAEAKEFENLDGAEPIWRVPAAKMKLRLAESEQEAMDFIIPLSTQATALVQAAIRAAKKNKYLFHSARHSNQPLSENALNVAYRRVLGWEGRHVPHGWRASFSTIMNERALDNGQAGDRQIIDLMLAHVPSGVEGRYNRAAYMPRRRQIAQEWADLLCADLASVESLLD